MALAKGADAVIDPAANDPVEAIRDLTHGEGADKALDATSSSEARQNAVRCVRKFGTACFVGIGGDVTLDVGNDLIRRQTTLIGHQTFSKVGQADCARFVADRKIDIDSLFTHSWTLEQAEEAYRLFDQQKTGKGFFQPS
jgi:threonine dehydrogenase-like Zn-dependent dehydrogenase